MATGLTFARTARYILILTQNHVKCKSIFQNYNAETACTTTGMLVHFVKNACNSSINLESYRIKPSFFILANSLDKDVR